MYPPPSPSDRIVIECTDVEATVSFWESNLNATCAVANEANTASTTTGGADEGGSGMEIVEHQNKNVGKKRPLPDGSSEGSIVGIQPGCSAAVRISPTTVLDIVDVSVRSSDDEFHPGDDSISRNEQQLQPRQRRTKRRKSPFDSIILYLSGSQIIDTIDRFKGNGILVSKVSEGACGGGQMPSHDAGGSSDGNGKYVSVHFCSPDGKWCELRTEDVAQLDEIREAALPSIQAYLRR